MIVAQVSDIHAAPSNDNLSRLDRALSWLAVVDPDALVVSGDLTDDGWTDGYKAIAERLGVMRCPVLLLPGNSDHPPAMQAAFKDRQDMIANCDAMHFATDIKEVRLLGLDTTVRGVSSGDVTPHLSWLEQMLDAPGARASLVFSHHHVVASGIPPIDEVMARGVQELGTLLRQRPQAPRALSSGHVHRPMTGMLGGIPAHICGSICAANPLWFGGPDVPAAMEPPMLMVHRLERGELVSGHVAV